MGLTFTGATSSTKSVASSTTFVANLVPPRAPRKNLNKGIKLAADKPEIARLPTPFKVSPSENLSLARLPNSPVSYTANASPTPGLRLMPI